LKAEVTVGILYHSTPITQVLIKLCVCSIKKFAGIETEVHVICNGESDDAIDSLVKYGLINKLYKMDLSHLGNASYQHGYAKDYLIKNCTTPYFFSTEPDVFYHQLGWLKKLQSYLSKEVKVVGPAFSFNVFDMRIIHPFCLLVETESFRETSATFKSVGFVRNKFNDEHEFLDDSALVSLNHLKYGYKLFFLGQCARFWQPSTVPLKDTTASFAYFPDNNECFAIHLGRSGCSPDRFNTIIRSQLEKMLASPNTDLPVIPDNSYGHPLRKAAMEAGLYSIDLSENQRTFLSEVDYMEPGPGSLVKQWRWYPIDVEIKKFFGGVEVQPSFPGKIKRLLKRALKQSA
jgi:hypothetical protein